jgi:hypothetical protein
MRPLTWLFLLLLAASPLWAKPKVDVRVKVDDGVGVDRAKDSLSRVGGASPVTTIYTTVFFLNVTVLSDNADAVAKNNGQWCISGDTGLDKSTEYHGTLDGANLELEIPQKNGKIKKKSFDVIARNWKKLSDLAQ